MTNQTKPNIANKTYLRWEIYTTYRLCKPNLANQIYQAKPTKPTISNLPNQYHQTKHTKTNMTNLPNLQTKHGFVSTMSSVCDHWICNVRSDCV